MKEAPIKLQQGIVKMKTVNGWLQPNDIGRYGKDYDTRAGIAWVGLGANQPEDTIYPTAFADGDGNPLDSANKYVMHYDKGTLQPTNASWSISQYKGNFYEVNALNRYVIAPWMPLKFNKDGSLDIYLRADSPGKDKESKLAADSSRRIQHHHSQLLAKRRRLERHLQESADQEGPMKKILMLAALAEAGTGVILLAYPSIVVRLLFDAEIVGAGVIMSRLAGIALIGLGAACWPGADTRRAFYGMVTYSVLAMLFLIYIGVRGEGVGLLLWPGVVVHAILIALLGGAWLKQRKNPAT